MLVAIGEVAYVAELPLKAGASQVSVEERVEAVEMEEKLKEELAVIEVEVHLAAVVPVTVAAAQIVVVVVVVVAVVAVVVDRAVGSIDRRVVVVNVVPVRVTVVVAEVIVLIVLIAVEIYAGI